MKRRALIVDDEREARHRLARLLSAHKEEIEIAGEASDGPSAVGMIEEARPDIVFLDVEMPGLDGFGVLDSLPQEQWPVIVFVNGVRPLRDSSVRGSRAGLLVEAGYREAPCRLRRPPARNAPRFTARAPGRGAA